MAALGLSCDMWELRCSSGAWLPCRMWNLSSTTRDRTHVLCIGRQILNHWTIREVPVFSSFLQLLLLFFWLGLDLYSCEWAFSSCGEWGLLLAPCCGGFSCRGAQALGARAPVLVAHGLSCLVPCGIFLDQGSNPNWQGVS